MALDPVSTGDPHVPAHNAERTALNDLEEALGTKIPFPGGLLTGDLIVWDGVQFVSTETRFFEGTGRPDGRVAAPVGSRYIDKAAAQGAVEWVKRHGGDSNTGWLCVAGDTGTLDIRALIDIGNGQVHTAQIIRMGQVVDIHLDMTAPTNRTAQWGPLTIPSGFRPAMSKYAALQDNNEKVAANGTFVSGNGGVLFYGVTGAKRDRWTGTWLTRDAWPSALPGTPLPT